MLGTFLKRMQITVGYFLNMQLALILGALSAAGMAYLYFKNFGCGAVDLACLSNRTDVWGQAGDFFGGFLNPILSLITITYVYKTFKSEKESQYWKVIDSIFDGIEDSLTKIPSDGGGTLNNNLIRLSGYAVGIEYSPTNFVKTFKNANLNFGSLHNYLAYYANINRKVSAENRRLFNAALVCRIGKVTVSIGLLQYLYVLIELNKLENNGIHRRSPTSEMCNIIIEAYSQFDYAPIKKISIEAKKLAVENCVECGKARKENYDTAVEDQ